MRGFIFTLDAIFSLVFAAFAVAALIYVSYSGYTPPAAQASQAGTVIGTLAATTLGQLGQASPLYGAGSTASWPQYGADEGFSFGTAHGPSGPYLLFSYSAPTNIIPAPVASEGYVAFAAGNQVYELNATTGTLAAGFPIATTNVIAAPLFYRREIIFANSTGYLSAFGTDGEEVWNTPIDYNTLTSAPEIEDGYLIFGASNASGGGRIYLLDPENGAIVENDPTVYNGIGANVLWIAHHDGTFYAEAGPGNVLATVDHQFINVTPSNSFASYGSFMERSTGNAALYGNLTAIYKSGVLNMTSIPHYGYTLSSLFGLAGGTVNTIPTLGGSTAYILDGSNFYAYTQGGQLFNVTLPSSATTYRYSDVALAYGNAYVAAGNSLYAFGPGGLQQNSSLLAALGSLYLEGRGGLADYLLYSSYGSDKIGMFINGSYAPALHVAKSNGVDSSIAIPAQPMLSPEAGASGAMSMCGWYKINNLATYKGLLYKGGTAASGGNSEYAIDPSGVQGFAVYGPSQPVANFINPTPLTANSVGVWYSFCFTYNSTASWYYLNGSAYQGAAVGGTPPSEGSGSLIFGGGAGGSSNVSMANLQIYNSILPYSRVLGIYYDGPFGWPKNTSSLVGWWPLLGDGNDYSGHSLVGFPYNMSYIASNYTGARATVGSAGIPVQLVNNETLGIYNVSVALWNS